MKKTADLGQSALQQGEQSLSRPKISTLVAVPLGIHSCHG